MPTLKKSDSPTTFVFTDGSYIDKLFARNIYVDETNPSAQILQINLAHYSNRKRGNLEDSDFELLQKYVTKITKLAIRDATVAKNIQPFSALVAVEIDIGASSTIRYSVKKLVVDHHAVSFEF